MSKVSVLIPARKEAFLRETIKDLYDNAAGEIEVIVVLDGDNQRLPRRKGLKAIRNKTVKGRRWCTNAAAEVATGKYIMKIDAHCTVGEGWDEILQADCADNWIVIPRRYWFDAVTWELKDKLHVDAMSYRYPYNRPYKPRIYARPDRARQERQKRETLSEDMSFQGSCWFMTKVHWERIGGMNEYGYGTFANEGNELGLMTWLGPWAGKVIRNKKTWYAHWAKPHSHWLADPEEAGRVTMQEMERGWLYSFDYWWYNRWEDRAKDFEWLLDKFWPLPFWPENWRELVHLYNRYDQYQGYGSATGDVIGNVPYSMAAKEAQRKQVTHADN